MAWPGTGQASSSSVEERSSLGHHRAEGAEAVVAEAGAAGGRRGSLADSVGTSPPVVDSSSEASSDGEAKGDLHTGGEGGGGGEGSRRTICTIAHLS